jgi:hypothetical protein
MKKFVIAIGPALLAGALAIGSVVICLRIFHAPPVTTKVASIVIIATTSLAVGATSLLRSKSK